MTLFQAFFLKTTFVFDFKMRYTLFDFCSSNTNVLQKLQCVVFSWKRNKNWYSKVAWLTQKTSPVIIMKRLQQKIEMKYA